MKNYERMIKLVTAFFGTRTDPDQISVTDEERERLEQLHPATFSEVANDDGPIVWLLIFPTTKALMNLFLEEKLTERELLEQTQPGDNFEAVYLCSAYVLPEFRKQGLTQKLTLDAIKSMQKDHAIKALFYWPFSEEGKRLAQTVAAELALPLLERNSD